MNLQRFPLGVSALVLSLAQMAAAAPSCSVRSKIPEHARTFAKANEQDSWREYRSQDQVPDLKLDRGMSARFWEEKDKTRSAYVVEPGEDTWTYAHYCFNKNGELESADFEIRTSLGWGLRADGSASNNGFDPHTVVFINLKSGKVIPKPEGVSSVPVGLKPIMYKNVSALPFASLLADPHKAAPKSTGAPKLNAMASMRLR